MASRRQNLTRTEAWTCALVNQCATPGLGSLLGRRIVPGLGQMAFAVAGFVLLLGWMARYFQRLALEQLERPAPHTAYGWMAKWGAICFGIGWLWSLFTSVRLLRQSKGAGAGEQNP